MDDVFFSIKSSVDASVLTGLAFEEYLCQLFETLGYESEKTKPTGDFGGDILLHENDKTIVVQAKQYSGLVGFDAVKEVHFAKSFYSADEAWVVTTSEFTSHAIDGAVRVGVRLINGTSLTTLIEDAHRVLSGQQPKMPKAHGGKTAHRGRSKSEFEISNTEAGFEGKCVLAQYRGSSAIVNVPNGIVALGMGAFAAEHGIRGLNPP